MGRVWHKAHVRSSRTPNIHGGRYLRRKLYAVFEYLFASVASGDNVLMGSSYLLGGIILMDGTFGHGILSIHM